MIKQFAKTIIITTSLVTLASMSFAAVPNSDPSKGIKCPVGQVAVKKNGMWVCRELGIKSNTPAQNATSASTMKKVAPSKPGRAKPDLIVYSAEKSNTKNNVVVVHVKNIGSSISKGGHVNVNAGGVNSAAAMPDVTPGQIRLIYVNFRSDVKSGRAMIKADSNNAINESNETNNVKHVTL